MSALELKLLNDHPRVAHVDIKRSSHAHAHHARHHAHHAHHPSHHRTRGGTPHDTSELTPLRTRSGDAELTPLRTRSGDAIDQVKFVYADKSEHTLGHDSGKADPRSLILSEGEHIVRVTHETFENFTCAAAAIEFETNRHRVFAYRPRAMTTGWKSEQMTVVAEPGHEIVALRIWRGTLRGSEQQRVPQAEVVEHRARWYAIVAHAAAEDEEEDARVTHFTSLSEARAAFANEVPAVQRKKGRAALLLDCIELCALKRVGEAGALACAEAAATAKGLLAARREEDVSMVDAIRTLFRVLNKRSDDLGIRGAAVGRRDLYRLLLVMGLLTASFYLELEAHMLTGNVITIAAGGAADGAGDGWVARLGCAALGSDCAGSAAALRDALIVTFMWCQAAKCFFYVANVYVHHNACDERNHRLRITAFDHVLSLDQAFFEHSIGS